MARKQYVFICGYSKCAKKNRTENPRKKYCNESCRVAAWKERNVIQPKEFIKKFQQLDRLNEDVQEIKKHLGISEKQEKQGE